MDVDQQLVATISTLSDQIMIGVVVVVAFGAWCLFFDWLCRKVNG